MTTRQATTADYDAIAQLFADTILHVNIRDYSPEQVKIWSERVKDKHAGWQKSPINIFYW